MEEYTLSDFNLSQAINGNSLGYKDDDGSIIIADSFEYDVPNRTHTMYVTFGSMWYNMTKSGMTYKEDGSAFKQMYLINTTITKTTGTRITKVTNDDGESNAKPWNPISTTASINAVNEETFSISTLQPREEIAVHCLESMLSKYDYPLNIDNTRIKQLVNKSFLFAQEFINQAVLYREKETTSSTVESNDYASVDSDSLSSDTDKLLFNIATALTNLMAQSKNQYADQQKNGLKVNTADITVKSTFPNTINANISGSINAEVGGEVTVKQKDTESTE